MCTVSMVGDHFNDYWKKYIPNTPNSPLDPGYPNNIGGGIAQTFTLPIISRDEFDALKKEVELMKGLLKRAKLYDESNNEPDCEMEDKVKFLKQIAEAVGVDLSEIFGNKEQKS